MSKTVASLVAVALALAVAAGGCVDGVRVEGAPCPCPADHVCCAGLNDTCVRTGGDCPERYPPSSRAACAVDADCAAAELCLSWGLADGAPGGPGECRRRCVPTTACAESEACEPALHDGLPMEPVNVALACVDAQPPAPCAQSACGRCGLGAVGRTRCAGEGVQGCFLALHPVCGVTCHDVPLERCPEACVESAEGAYCDTFGVGACASFPCDACPEGVLPGDLYCAGDVLMACAVAAVGGDLCHGPCACDAICARQVVERCATSCVSDGAPGCRAR